MVRLIDDAVGELAGDVLDSELFPFMLEPDAVATVAPVLREESLMVAKVVASLSPVATVVGIGDAAQTYRNLAADIGANYVCVDPCIRPDRSILRRSDKPAAAALFFGKAYDKLDSRELPHGNVAWVFHFNLFPYLASASDTMSKMCIDGDVVLIGTWGRSDRSRELKRQYDNTVARLSFRTAELMERRRVVVTLPRLGRYRIIKGDLVDLHVLSVNQRNAEVA
jgi:hypothetical protein